MGTALLALCFCALSLVLALFVGRHIAHNRQSKDQVYVCRCCAVVDGCAIPSFHIDAFILKSTLMAEWNTEKEFDLLKTDFSQNPEMFSV